MSILCWPQKTPEVQNPDYGLGTHCSEMVQASEVPKHRTHSYTANDKNDWESPEPGVASLRSQPAGTQSPRPGRVVSAVAHVLSETLHD